MARSRHLQLAIQLCLMCAPAALTQEQTKADWLCELANGRGLLCKVSFCLHCSVGAVNNRFVRCIRHPHVYVLLPKPLWQICSRSLHWCQPMWVICLEPCKTDSSTHRVHQAFMKEVAQLHAVHLVSSLLCPAMALQHATKMAKYQSAGTRCAQRTWLRTCAVESNSMVSGTQISS